MIVVERVPQFGDLGRSRYVPIFGQIPVTRALYARHAIDFALKTNTQLFTRMRKPKPRYGNRSRIEAHPTLFDSVLRYALNWARIPSYPKMYYWPRPEDRYIVRNREQVGAISQAYLTNILNTNYNFFRAAQYVRPPSVVREPDEEAAQIARQREIIKAGVARERAAAARRQPTAAERFRAGIVAQQQRALAIQQAQPAREAARRAQEAEREAGWKASEQAFELRHEIIAQEIGIEREVKRQQQQAGQERAMQRRLQASAARREREVARAIQERERKAQQATAKELEKERKRAARDVRKAEQAALVAANPKQPGSPPISAAIAEVAAEYGITTGELHPAAFATFTAAVLRRAKKLRSRFYYHRLEHGKVKFFYFVDQRTVDTILKQEGYIRQAPLAIPRPVVQEPIKYHPIEPIRQPTVTAPPGRRYTESGSDPLIQRAIDLVMQQAGLRSGEEMQDIAAFRRLVLQKANLLAQAEFRVVRPGDVTAAINARVRFILSGVGAM